VRPQSRYQIATNRLLVLTSVGSRSGLSTPKLPRRAPLQPSILPNHGQLPVPEPTCNARVLYHYLHICRSEANCASRASFRYFLLDASKTWRVANSGEVDHIQCSILGRNPLIRPSSAAPVLPKTTEANLETNHGFVWVTTATIIRTIYLLP